MAAFESSSEWMNKAMFVRYMRHFIAFVKSIPNSPFLSFLDNHLSHLSVETLGLINEKGVHILIFPPALAFGDFYIQTGEDFFQYGLEKG